MAVQREYLSPNEIAELLGVSPFTIRRYIKLGELRAVKLLGGFRVHRAALQAFLKAHEVNTGEEELSPEETAAATSATELKKPPDSTRKRIAPAGRPASLVTSNRSKAQLQPARVSPGRTTAGRSKPRETPPKKPRRP